MSLLLVSKKDKYNVIRVDSKLAIKYLMDGYLIVHNSSIKGNK